MSLRESKEFRKANLLWPNGKKEEKESSSGSGEERGGAKVSSAPAKTGVKEGRKEG